MLKCALLLVLLVGLDLPHEAEMWPIDEVVIQQIEEYAVLGHHREQSVRNAVAYEQRSMLGADMLFVGAFVGEGPPAAGQHGPCATLLFLVEQCLKGECPDTVSLHWSPRASRAFFNMPLGTRPLDWSEPELGRRYLLLGRASRDEPEFLWGGVGHERYELREGVVVAKGVPELEFLVVVQDLLDAAAGDSSAHESEAAAVQPPN